MTATACQRTHDNATPSHRTQTATSAQVAPIKVLRLKDMVKKLGIARSTIYDWMNPDSKRYDATFPRSFKIGRHSIGWFEHQVDEWLALRAAALLEQKQA